MTGINLYGYYETGAREPNLEIIPETRKKRRKFNFDNIFPYTKEKNMGLTKGAKSLADWEW